MQLVSAVHNLTWSSTSRRALHTTQDACQHTSTLAPLLQWQWLPLATAALELCMQQDVPAPPAPSNLNLGATSATSGAAHLAVPVGVPFTKLLPDLSAILHVLQLEALATIEQVEGTGVVPWQLFWCGSPAGLTLLASMLRHCARCLPECGPALPPLPPSVVAAVEVVSSMGIELVRTMNTLGPLPCNVAGDCNDSAQLGGTPLEDCTFAGPAQQPNTYLGAGWSYLTWGLAALGLWQAAHQLSAAAAQGSQWQEVATAALRNASTAAPALLLRAAEEVLRAELDRGVLSDEYEARLGDTRPCKEVTAQLLVLQSVDSAREQLTLARARTHPRCTEGTHGSRSVGSDDMPARSSSTQAPSRSARRTTGSVLECCVVLSRSLQLLFPATRATTAPSRLPPVSQPITPNLTPHAPPTTAAPRSPARSPAPVTMHSPIAAAAGSLAAVPSPSTPPLASTVSPCAASVAAAPSAGACQSLRGARTATSLLTGVLQRDSLASGDPWDLPWHAHPMSWVQWEAAVHHITRKLAMIVIPQHAA